MWMIRLCCAVMFCAASALAADAWPFPAPQGPTAQKLETPDRVGLYNDKVGILIRKADAVVQGVYSPQGWSLVNGAVAPVNTVRPFWAMQLMAANGEKPVNVDVAGTVKNARWSFKQENEALVLTAEFPNAAAGEWRCNVRATISLANEADRIAWTLAADMQGKAASVWTVTFPQMVVTAPDEDPAGNWLVIPYRQGVQRVFGKGAPKSAQSLPYPGPSAKYQFWAAYGKSTARGFYLATEDGEGYDKVLNSENHPDKNASVLSIAHIPANRGVAGTGFSMPYRAVTMPFTGDWWDAARIYRQWWAKQVWAAQGLLRDRKDVPDWAKRTPVITRPSSTKPQRTVASNLANSIVLSDLLEKRPFMGTWYGAFVNLGGAEGGLDKEGHGHVRPLKPEIESAIRELAARDVHHIAYIQSLIYDPMANVPTAAADNALADLNVCRDRSGKISYYNEKEKQMSMDRGSRWWQDRIADCSMVAMKAGFQGIYLDSFGKSSPECFDPRHGHPVGGGNTAIAGQRQLATHLLETIRKVYPQAILSGEAPIEAFRDLVHVHLLAMNCYEGLIPVGRTIWGDYSLDHGRVIRPSDKPEDGPVTDAELARLFVDGTIMGRFFTDGSIFLTQPRYADELAFFQKLVRYTDKGVEYLRFGEYLHPLDLPNLPTVKFKESAQNTVTNTPVVINSVTRSHADGSVALALVNIGEAPVSVEVPIDPAWRAKGNAEAVLNQMDESGQTKEVARGASTWKQPVTVAPRDVVFLVLK